MKKISVIIPFFKDYNALNEAKQSLAIQKTANEIFIRDNTNDNILYTKAINEGLRKFCYSGLHDYVLVMNQDAILSSNCLEVLIQTMEENPKCGIVTPIAVDEKGNSTWYGGLEAFPWGRHRTKDSKDIESEPFLTPWANGACMMFRVEMVKDIGLLDENMRFICSDADYSFTARSRGWEILVAPLAIIEHALGASASSQNDWLNQIKLSDQIYFGEKWLSGDLYRKLAYEGSQLTTLKVADELRKSRGYHYFNKIAIQSEEK